MGWGAPGRVGGTAAALGREAGPAPSTSLCLEAPDLARNPSDCESAAAHPDECLHLVLNPFLRSWSELGSDLGIRPVRPRPGRCILIPEELSWEVPQTGSVVVLLI